MIASAIFAVIVVISALSSGLPDETPKQPDASDAAPSVTQPVEVPAEPVEPAPAQPAPPPAAPKAIPAISLSGVGKSVKKISLQEGVSIFRMSHKGSANFIIELLDASTGESVDLLVNEIGRFSGSKIVGVAGGKYALEIDASSSWTIKIEQPRPTSASSPASVKGSGPTAVGPIQLSSGFLSFAMSHKGESNFIVELLDSYGEPIELLANEIGSFKGESGAAISDDGIYWISVDADGSWSIAIS